MISVALAMLSLGAALDAELKPVCERAQTATASGRAQQLFDTAPLPNRRKHAFSCANKSVSVFQYPVPPGDAQALGMRLTLELWEENATNPTLAAPDEVFVQDGSLWVVSGPAEANVVRRLLERKWPTFRVPKPNVMLAIAEEIDCSPKSEDTLNLYCVVSKLKTAGYRQPKQPRALVGASVQLLPRQKFRDAALKETRLALAVVGGGRLRVADVEPGIVPFKRHPNWIDVLQATLSALTGRTHESIDVPGELDGEMSTFVQNADTTAYPIADGKSGGAAVQLKNPARAWTISANGNDVYVVIEDAAEGGQWLSLFPDVPHRRVE